MALAILVKIDGSCSSPALGNLQLDSQITQDSESKIQDALTSSDSLEQKKDSPREIRIVLEKPDDVYSQLWQLNQKHPTLNLVELKIIPNEIASKTGRAWVRKEGKLSYDCNWVQDKEIRKCEPKYFLNFPRKSSTYKRRIFRGFHEYGTPVAIERIEMSSDTILEIEREFRILQELEIHENFIRYFSFETDEKAEFVYIATELCLCSVDDLFQDNSEKRILKQEVLSSLTTKEILFQATRGLDYLHQNHFVHRNVKPSSFLIKEIQSRNGTSYAIKITDFRLTRQLDPSKDLSGSAASDGWEAPESKKEKQALRQSLDIFILGCFYHYVLTGEIDSKPKHPFGDSELTRIVKIPDPKTDVYQKRWKPRDIKDEEAIDLITKMIKFNESERPKLSKVLDHPYFNPTRKDYYPIYDYPIPGLCVIFNQEFFRSGLPYREGSINDWKRLYSTFVKLGFKVVVHHNLMSFDVKGEMKKLAAQDFSKCGCLVVCLLSHGVENAIAGSDGKWVNINKLKYKFSYNHCQSLYGKPKIFVVQACQGELEQNMTGVVPLSIGKTDSGTQINDESVVKLSNSSAAIKYMTSCFKGALFPYEAAPSRNPPIMDFITIKSTIPGFVSLRNSLTGTYFIQALCQKLEEEYIDNKTTDYDNFHDLEHILRGEGGVQSIMNSKIQKNQYRQTLLWEAYLSKYIRFRSIVRDVADKDEKDFEDGSSAEIFAQKYFYIPEDCFEYEQKPEEKSLKK